MASVARRPLAATDILDIRGHIVEDRLNQTGRWIDRLDKKLRLIARQRLMGRAREELAAGLSSFPFGRYVIFDLPIRDGIDVVRVRHSAGRCDRCLTFEDHVLSLWLRD